MSCDHRTSIVNVIINSSVASSASILYALANNKAHGVATPGRNLQSVSLAISSRGAIDVSLITVTSELGGIGVEKSKAGTALQAGKNLIVLGRI